MNYSYLIQVAGLLTVAIVVAFCIGKITVDVEEMRREKEEWLASSEHQECLEACKEQGYIIHISKPSNCVCDITKLVIVT